MPPLSRPQSPPDPPRPPPRPAGLGPGPAPRPGLRPAPGLGLRLGPRPAPGPGRPRRESKARRKVAGTGQGAGGSQPDRGRAFKVTKSEEPSLPSGLSLGLQTAARQIRRKVCEGNNKGRWLDTRIKITATNRVKPE